MTGLETIKQEILDEARRAAESRLEAARAQSAELLEEANAQAAAFEASLVKQAEDGAENEKARAKSSAEFQHRRAVLAAKQELISDTLQKAYESLRGADAETYFAFLKKMAGQFAQPLKGQLCLSAEDLARVPAGFEEEIQNIARIKGGELSLAKEGRRLDGGFLLLYGDIEENCTLRALFDAKRDELSDLANKLLF